MAEAAQSSPPIPATVPPAPVANPVHIDPKTADLRRLAALKSEYDKLRAQCEQGAKEGADIGKAKARKGDVVREMDTIKRKYRIQ